MQLLKRSEIYDTLKDFYVTHGIDATIQMCPHFSHCQAIAAPRKLTCGAGAHLGSLYGQQLKTVVVSLDTGETTAYTIDSRTETMETIEYENVKTCKQTKGTFELLVDLYKDNDISYVDVFKYVAMTNSAKCSGDKNKNKLSTAIYKKCAKYHHSEIEILQPDVVITQGVDSRKYLSQISNENKEDIEEYIKQTNKNEEEINKVREILSQYVKRMMVANKQVLLVTTPHPSARDGSWKWYKNNCLTEINRYINYANNKISGLTNVVADSAVVS